MKIFPAIDLRNGSVVRLTQGDYNAMDVFFDDPVPVVQKFKQYGAEHLHIVDLDGAKDGTLANFDTIQRIAENTNLFLQVGGGIRNVERVEQYLSIGVSRVILGTAALEDPVFLNDMVSRYGDKIAVGVDAKDGYVAVRGWKEVSQTDSVMFCKLLNEMGVKTIIYTDISKDGKMEGTNLAIYEQLQRDVRCNIIASGGISSLEEIQVLKKQGIYGAIVGKAIYLGGLSLADCIEMARAN